MTEKSDFDALENQIKSRMAGSGALFFRCLRLWYRRLYIRVVLFFSKALIGAQLKWSARCYGIFKGAQFKRGPLGARTYEATTQRSLNNGQDDYRVHSIMSLLPGDESFAYTDQDTSLHVRILQSI